VHDLVEYESRGIPSVMVASSEFVNASIHQATALGMPAVARRAAYVAHPIQDATDDAIRSKARDAYDTIVRALTEAEPSPPASHPE
jgi:hypothetical protein